MCWPLEFFVALITQMYVLNAVRSFIHYGLHSLNSKRRPPTHTHTHTHLSQFPLNTFKVCVAYCLASLGPRRVLCCRRLVDRVAMIADDPIVESQLAARAATGILALASADPRGEVIALSWARELLAGNDTVPVDSTELAVARDLVALNPDMWCRDAIQALLASRFERHSLCSRSAEVALLGIDRVSTFQQLKGTGAAFMHWLGVLAINQCARRLLCLPQPGGCLPEVLFTMRMQVFDETPSTLSVSVATGEIVNARHEDARTVKVFQFRTTFTVLYKIADTIFEVVLPVPSHMQSADRNTAEVVMHLLDSWFDIPGLLSLEDAASYRLQLSIADRGSQNVKATRLWSESCPLDGKDNELTLWCTTHGAATALKASASLCGQLVSGCISIALAARPAGAITLLRDILYWFIRSRLCLRRGTPPEDSDTQNRWPCSTPSCPTAPQGP